MASEDSLKLNLGSGRRFHPDWHNIDFEPVRDGVILHDLTRPLPYDNESVTACHSAHVLGHFHDGDARRFLREQYRILKPGGVARFAVPDLQQIVTEYLTLIGPLCEGDDSRADDYDWNRIEMYDQIARSNYGGRMAEYLTQPTVPNRDYIISRIGEEGRELMDLKPEELPVFKSHFKCSHLPYYFKKARRKMTGMMVRLLGGKEIAEAYRVGCFRQFSGEVQFRIYDFYSLSRELHAAGFKTIVQCEANESAIENFASYRLDTDENGVERKPESLYAEAIKD